MIRETLTTETEVRLENQIYANLILWLVIIL